MLEKPNPRIGVGVFVIKDEKFLVGQRRSSHGEGSWSVPGGHLEFGESFEETAKREVLEETGLQIGNIALLGVTNDVFNEEMKHYVTIWMTSDYLSGDAQIIEPDKFIDHKWVNFETLPRPLFLPWQQLFESDYMNELKSKIHKSSANR